MAPQLGSRCPTLMKMVVVGAEPARRAQGVLYPDFLKADDEELRSEILIQPPLLILLLNTPTW